MFDWLFNLWNSIQQLFRSKNLKILILGLDNAGKTTLLKLLQHNRISMNAPTITPNLGTVEIFGSTIQAFDMGGHEAARSLWNDYMIGVDGIIFIIDVADRERIMEAKIELDKLLQDEALNDTPFLILGNKIDVPNALHEMDFKASLCMHLMRETHHIQMCSIVNKINHLEGIKWLINKA